MLKPKTRKIKLSPEAQKLSGKLCKLRKGKLNTGKRCGFMPLIMIQDARAAMTGQPSVCAPEKELLQWTQKSLKCAHKFTYRDMAKQLPETPVVPFAAILLIYDLMMQGLQVGRR